MISEKDADQYKDYNAMPFLHGWLRATAERRLDTMHLIETTSSWRNVVPLGEAEGECQSEIGVYSVYINQSYLPS